MLLEHGAALLVGQARVDVNHDVAVAELRDTLEVLTIAVDAGLGTDHCDRGASANALPDRITGIADGGAVQSRIHDEPLVAHSSAGNFRVGEAGQLFELPFSQVRQNPVPKRAAAAEQCGERLVQDEVAGNRRAAAQLGLPARGRGASGASLLLWCTAQVHVIYKRREGG